MEGMLCRCRPAIQRSGLGRDRPGCPAVARPRVGGRDSNAKKVDRAKPSKSQARLLSRWTWQANSSRIRTSEIAARLDLFLTRGLRSQQLNRNAKPLRGLFAILEHADFDRRILSQYGMQLALMNSRSIGSENRGLHRRTAW